MDTTFLFPFLFEFTSKYMRMCQNRRFLFLYFLKNWLVKLSDCDTVKMGVPFLEVATRIDFSPL